MLSMPAQAWAPAQSLAAGGTRPPVAHKPFPPNAMQKRRLFPMQKHRPLPNGMFNGVETEVFKDLMNTDLKTFEASYRLNIDVNESHIGTMGGRVS